MIIQMRDTDGSWNIIATDETNTAKVALKRIVKAYPFASYRVCSIDGRILAEHYAE
jgi:hypothetical protein